MFQNVKGRKKHFVLSCRYYPAVIDDILEDGSCTVTFAEYGNTDVTQVWTKGNGTTGER